MRMEFISIGDIVRDNSCEYSCIDKVVGVRYNKHGTFYKKLSRRMSNLAIGTLVTIT